VCSEASAIVHVGVVPGTEILLEVSSSVISFVDEEIADLASDIASLNYALVRLWFLLFLFFWMCCSCVYE